MGKTNLTPRQVKFLHGGDYNPDQWLDRPDILDQDIRMMQKTHCNCVSLGIFAWAKLEPEEGKYDFTWLDQVIDKLWKGGINVILATPSGARPAWMAQNHPEVLRTNSDYSVNHFGERENHCWTSPYYRRKVREINTALAKRYSSHPAVILWHLSNEYNGDCYCPMCQAKFREFLKKKYGTIENLNHCWWNDFWAHTYTSWEQVEAPTELGESSTMCQKVDWRRFTTQQVKDFMKEEKDAVKAVDPSLPVTNNLMLDFFDYDYFSLAEEMDVVSWDSYPRWHSGDDVAVAARTAMNHDIMRSLKNQNFLLMESTPTTVNWAPINKLKRPNMHLTSSLQAVAHGSDSVLYFQWRKGRGSNEMWHGAVMDHDCREDSRVIRDVTSVGTALEKIQDDVRGVKQDAKVCIIYDWDNRWAIEYARTCHNDNMQYLDVIRSHYTYFWEKGYTVDFRDMRDVTDLSPYELVVAPMLFMFRGGIEQKFRTFVENGGTMLMTYFSGMVDETNLAYQYGRPHGLMDVLGLAATEVEALYPQDENGLRMDGKVYPIHRLAEICEAEDAETVGTYSADFYEGMPCLTRHRFGKGWAWYLAGEVDSSGIEAVYDKVVASSSLKPQFDDKMPHGVIPTIRGNVLFLQNYNGENENVSFAGNYTDLITGETCCGSTTIPSYGIRALKKKEN